MKKLASLPILALVAALTATAATPAAAQTASLAICDDPTIPASTSMTGTTGDDIIIGTPGRDIIYGHEGNDIICGRGGDDLILAGPGNDQISGGFGNDKIRGGGGKDEIHGNNGADRLLGMTGADTIDGGQGKDRLNGAGGNDQLHGNDGLDRLDGGQGADTLNGGPGPDQLTGGPDTDRFFPGPNSATCHDINIDLDERCGSALVIDGPALGNVTMGRANWSSGYLQAQIVHDLLEDLGYTVSDPSANEFPPDLGYQAMALGEIDLWANSWYPGHLSWWEGEFPDGSQVGDTLERLEGSLMPGGGMQGRTRCSSR